MNNSNGYEVGAYAMLHDIEGATIAAESDSPLGRQEYGQAATRQVFLQGGDAKWAVDTHANGYAFGLMERDSVYTVILFGNEDSPYQVWASARVAFRPNFDVMERIA